MHLASKGKVMVTDMSIKEVKNVVWALRILKKMEEIKKKQ